MMTESPFEEAMRMQEKRAGYWIASQWRAQDSIDFRDLEWRMFVTGATRPEALRRPIVIPTALLTVPAHDLPTADDTAQYVGPAQ